MEATRSHAPLEPTRPRVPEDPSPAADRVLDELLVVRVRQGSRAAFEQLVGRWQERLWRHARRLTGRDDVAWDVLQESWMAIGRGLPALRDRKSVV